MNTLQIRFCQSNDISHILEIRKRAFSHFAPSAYSPKEVQTLLDDVNVSELEEMIENKSLFVAKENHTVVGCGGWFGESVRHMYVSPEETKKGIGSTLLRVLEEDYKNRTNNSIIKAGVILYARLFYEKNGYEFLQIDTDWDGSKFNRMQKKLL
jgi:predicted N-acetyltransferase YhbS